MSDRTNARHEKLRLLLTDIAERLIAEGGMEKIKARPLAQEAGCALGAIYTVFPDLTALVMQVNGRTFRRLGTDVTAAVAARPDAPAVERLVTMSHAYLAFAADNTRAWRTLFDLEMSTEDDVPQWYLDELQALFAIIKGPLREIEPEASEDALELKTRTLFSSVHGIVLLGLERRISGVPMDAMKSMTDLLIRGMTTR